MTVREKIIRRRVLDEIARDDRVGVADLEADVSAGTVTLSGTVSSFLARRAASEAAWIVPGVRSVRNQITIRYPETMPLPSDTEIQSRAISRLDWDPDLDIGELRVTVRNGNVLLEGTVDAYWKKVHAERQIQDLAGVLLVNNELGVVPSASVSDKRIADAIIESLDHHMLIDPNTLDVEVDNGHVTLSGTVTSYSAREAAHNAALYTAGVRSLRDEIAVVS